MELMLLSVLQLAVLPEAAKILGPELQESYQLKYRYNKLLLLNWFLFLMITCDTGRAGHSG